MEKTIFSWVNGFYRFGPASLILLLPVFFRGDYILTLGQTICYYAIAVVGLNILIGYTGQISLGHSGFLAIGAYTSALLATKLGWPLWVTFPISALFSGIAGFIIAFPAIRTRGLYLAMITVALGIMIEMLSQRWVDLTGGTMGIYGVPTPTFFGKGICPFGYFYLIAVTWVILQCIADNLVESRWGKILIALKHSENAAKSVGISINRQKVIAFVLSAVYTGIAGFFIAHQTGYINSDNFNIHTSIFFIVALLIGGMGSRWGPLVGVTLLTFINHLLADLYAYRFFIYGGTLLTILILMPEGIMGVIEKRLHTYLRRRDEIKTESEESELKDIGTVSGIKNHKGDSNYILEIKKLTYYFGGLSAVNEVYLSVEKGQIHAIIGPNGAGKTTLINLVAGNLKPHYGNILYKGLQLNGLSSHHRAMLGIARTFQNLQLFHELSVLDNILLGGYRHFTSGFVSYALSLPSSHMEEKYLKESALNLLRFVGIRQLANTTVNDLPYGYQKLVEIARALALKPDLLLLDEPIAGLNRMESQVVSHLLERLRDMGVTILLIEHNMDFIMRISDRVSVINFGTKIAEGTPQEIQNDPKVIEAYLGRGDFIPSIN